MGDKSPKKREIKKKKAVKAKGVQKIVTAAPEVVETVKKSK